MQRHCLPWYRNYNHSKTHSGSHARWYIRTSETHHPWNQLHLSRWARVILSLTQFVAFFVVWKFNARKRMIAETMHYSIYHFVQHPRTCWWCDSKKKTQMLVWHRAAKIKKQQTKLPLCRQWPLSPFLSATTAQAMTRRNDNVKEHIKCPTTYSGQ